MIKMFFNPTDMRYMFKNCRTIDVWRKSIKRKIRNNNKIFYKKYRYLKIGQ